MNSKIKISIVGTSGRGNIINNLTKDLFNKMVIYTDNHISNYLKENNLDWKNVELISGGAAWSDHIAVKIYKNHLTSSLNIYIPCKWNNDKKQYEDNGKDWRINPGKSSNNYHNKFSKKMEYNTLKELDELKSCFNDDYFGFHKRDSIVAKCDIMIAFTFSNSSEPESGGTKFTWSKCKTSLKYHISINNL